ncbi:HNH endonuclease family protein [Streptoalloteichus hindustanus]|uniref:GmrSD restriction endonucleases C-terminal domain-containing protein n=1 Tax=Streptoalloteichus hindustanus TaxID=2017 RepID=A0A1M4UF30_STRHI|nr:HNH endonuclease family protein [Streptoalloteichus hindustanus]SHE55294.1 Protein of unknown function [Streptoalloteichus hindustanus]
MTVGRLLRALLAGLAFTLVVTLGWAVPASAAPPNIPSAATARSELAALRVAAPGSMSGYSRKKFPHWITISGSCNTRETVLKRDGDDVDTDEDCYPTSGTWYSPYDGETVDSPSDIDIDHVVPLANAWRSGASSWTTEKRRQFANDLRYPQLIAVTASSNRAKGDQSPDDWKPPVRSYWCTYAKMWVHVKHHYALTITSSEKGALSDMLGRC